MDHSTKQCVRFRRTVEQRPLPRLSTGEIKDRSPRFLTILVAGVVESCDWGMGTGDGVHTPTEAICRVAPIPCLLSSSEQTFIAKLCRSSRRPERFARRLGLAEHAHRWDWGWRLVSLPPSTSPLQREHKCQTSIGKGFGRSNNGLLGCHSRCVQRDRGIHCHVVRLDNLCSRAWTGNHISHVVGGRGLFV